MGRSGHIAYNQDTGIGGHYQVQGAYQRDGRYGQWDAASTSDPNSLSKSTEERGSSNRTILLSDHSFRSLEVGGLCTQDNKLSAATDTRFGGDLSGSIPPVIPTGASHSA